ncbi:ATP-binding protein [Teredinibacter sp. KSP-S5-2]|uniref:PAS domain-containing sensor histidine kinase n=1 Tax=Teredinibacter sp. KSP-S5-2 TaxID=3034506 RepID=UPI002934DDD3|nr:ATP-binding protein [Teredinibacter sp. KSP-S5-2]WNO09107.1 ATP-binding protein [Teredinibacter sp. KSP-S5-2]
MSTKDLGSSLKEWAKIWPDGIIAVDHQHKIVDVSETGLNLLQAGKNDLLEKSLHHVLCVNIRNLQHSEEDCPFNGAGNYSNTDVISAVWNKMNGEYIGVDYRIIHFPEDPTIKYILTFIDNRDLDYNRAELDKFAAYINNSPNPIAEFDREGYLIFSNEAMQEHLVSFGFSDEGQARILPVDFQQICRQCVEQKKTISSVEVNVLGRWFSWYFQPVVIQDEITILGYAINISEQKRAQEEARLARERSRRDFYAKMMHELRTPLNAIVGFADVLLWRASKNLSEKDLRLLKTIKNSGLQLNDQISDTLDISKIEAGKMTVELEQFDLQELLSEIDEQMRTLAANKGLIYEFICPGNLDIVTDKRKLRQILLNLISNGVKYTQEGNVTCIVEPIIEKRSIEFRIEDTGIGIAEDQLSGLFQSYQRIKDEKNKGILGTGLGLALVEELVRLLRGTIHVESVYGEGSQFIVTLPSKPLE